MTKVSRIVLPAMLSLRAKLTDRSLIEDLSRAAGTPLPGVLLITLP